MTSYSFVLASCVRGTVACSIGAATHHFASSSGADGAQEREAGMNRSEAESPWRRFGAFSQKTIGGPLDSREDVQFLRDLRVVQHGTIIGIEFSPQPSLSRREFAEKEFRALNR